MKPILLTFSEKNKDVYKLINDRDKKEFKQNTDYICNAIRFFETYKNYVGENNIDNDTILEQKILRILEKYSVCGLNNNAVERLNENAATKIIEEVDKLKNIEEDIDDIDVDED